MLHHAFRPSRRVRDEERTAFIRLSPARSAASLFEEALGWERRLATLSEAVRARLDDDDPARHEFERRSLVASTAMHTVLTAPLSVSVRHAMLASMMPTLLRDLEAASRAARGCSQPSWRRLRETERGLRQRFEHAVAALERRQWVEWKLRQFVHAGTFVLEHVVLAEPRLGAVQLALVEAGLGALALEAGLER